LHSRELDSSRAEGVSSGQQVGYGDGSATGGQWHALLWQGTANSVVDLHPSGLIWSVAVDISGSQQVGWGYGSTIGGQHALLWWGTPDSVVDLHPIGFGSSRAHGVSGTQQVGYGVHIVTGEAHALLWSGTAGSCVDLNPSGFIGSVAWGVSGGQQIGYGWLDSTTPHALLWRGTPSSYVDLTPIGFDLSCAYDTSGGKQVGYGRGVPTNGETHALLWLGTPESYIDLHPSNGFEATGAYGIAGGQQVGVGIQSATGEFHALVWSGTANSVVDLHSYLPSEYNRSEAWDIDSSGIIVGLASVDDYSPPMTGEHAVMWVPLIYVEIDIKPGSYPNSINLGNEGVIPVAILSSTEFDATTVDPATVELAGAGVELRGKSNKAMAHREDVNKDGLIDLVVQITTQNLDPGAFQDGYATLTGKTYDGLFIEGADEIIIVPK